MVKRRKAKGLWPFLLLGLGWVALLIVILADAALVSYMRILERSPRISPISVQPNIYTSIVYDADGNEIDRFEATENREYVQIESIPGHLINALIAVEDERFREHSGVDVRSMGRAAYVIASTGGDRVEGASTLTQQLIKNSITKVTHNNIITKLQEQYLAVEFERGLTETLGSKDAAKDYILEQYLNLVNFGHGYYGICVAAREYFGKEVSDLTLAESAVLVATINSPARYAPNDQQENNRFRQGLVLGKMLELEMVSNGEHDAALAEDVYAGLTRGASVDDGEQTVHSYYVDAVYEAVSDDLQTVYGLTKQEAANLVYNGGLYIHTAMDAEMQRVMDEVYADPAYFPDGEYELDVRYHLSVMAEGETEFIHHHKSTTVKSMENVQPFVENMKATLTNPGDTIVDRLELVPQPQSAMVVLDHTTGQVKALIGGRGEKTVDLALNRATDSERQPGSVFKVLASYLPAMDLGLITPATVIDDVPFSWGAGENEHQFSNWWGERYRGLSTVRKGIYDSMNVLAVKNLVDTGIDKAYDYLTDLGITTLLPEGAVSDKGAALALGGITRGVTQLELAAAYGTIANGGEYVEPIFYTKVLSHDGKVLLENSPESRRVIKPTTAYLLTDMMEDVVTKGTGGEAAFVTLAMPIAGKTGTTTDTKDLVFTGYTPYLTASIWYGYDTPKTIEQDHGYQKRIWRDVMERIHLAKGWETVGFAKPEGLVEAYVCMDSGALATSLCKADVRGNRGYDEMFAEGTEPTEYCSVHQSVTVCEITGLRANSYCPDDQCRERVGIVRPIPYDGTASVADRQYELGRIGTCTLHNSETYAAQLQAELEAELKEAFDRALESEANEGQD